MTVLMAAAGESINGPSILVVLDELILPGSPTLADGETAMTNPATGSSHAIPVSRTRTSPVTVEMLSRRDQGFRGVGQK